MMTMNIVLAILLLLYFQTTLSDNDQLAKLWFPTKLPEEKLVKCGLDYDIYGISIVDDYLYQFQKCSVIIYPPPLKKYLNKSMNHLNLDNGYYYLFEELLSGVHTRLCAEASQSSSSEISTFSLIHRKLSDDELNDHILLYHINYQHKIEIFDLSKNINSHIDYNVHYKENYKEQSKIKLLTNGYEQYRLQNDHYDAYRLRGDPSTDKKTIDYGFVCIRKTDKDKYFISKTEYDNCEKLNLNLTQSLLNNIHLSFSVYKKLIMISQQDNHVLITDIKLFEPKNSDEEFQLQIKSMNDFFVCSSRPKQNNNTNDTSNEIMFKDNIFIIIPVIIIIIIIIIIIATVVYIKKYKKKKLNKKNILMKSKSSLTSCVGAKIDNKLDTDNTSDTLSLKILNKINNNTFPTNKSITIRSPTTTAKTINR